MIFPLILVLVSACTHFIYFGFPAAVVFDEVYFAAFVGDYSSGSYYFDIHPPLGKLLVHFFGELMGTTYGVDVSAIGNSLPWGIVLLRLLPTIAGFLLPLVIYYICRYLNFSKLTSFTAGMLIILENSLLVQSRFLLLDSTMLLFGFSAILLYLIYIKKGEKWKLILLGSALLCAGAFSIKWTGLAYPLLIVIAEIVRRKNILHTLKFISAYAILGCAIYFSVFAIHFAYLTRTGPGDAFMSDRFQKTLEGNAHENDPALVPKKFFGKAIELNVRMFESNQTLTATHPYSSRWYTWPVLIRPVFYWEGAREGDTKRYIYLLGNPFVYLLGTFSILLLLSQIIFNTNREKRMLFIVTGFLVNFLPFIFIGRVMFIYHYEAALVFSIIAICYLLETAIPEYKKIKAVSVVLFLALILFLFFSPLTYGFPLTDAALHARMWLPTWR
jgi:dolichyl-phosphate-mannose-protein mannosyltransferase